MFHLEVVVLFLVVVGLVTTLLTQGHDSGSRQNQASACHFLWLSQQLDGAELALEPELFEFFCLPPLWLPPPPRPLPDLPPRLGFLTAATSVEVVLVAADPLRSLMAATPALTSVTLVDR